MLGYRRFLMVAFLSVGLLWGCSNDGDEAGGGQKSDALNRNQAIYITMPDGVKIAAEVWLPDGQMPEGGYPAIVRFERYWRAIATSPATNTVQPVVAYFNKQGFAYVVADLRGAGASFGNRKIVFSVEETNDFPHVINWVADQKWSNGSVATMGISYPGNTSEHASFNAPDALKAIIPRFSDFDWYSSILFPGGLQNKIITSEWGHDVRALDLNDASLFGEPKPGKPKILGIKPVDKDVDGALLGQALKGHEENVFMQDLFGPVIFRDDIKEAENLQDDANSLVAIYKFRELAEKSSIPAFHWGSFMDAGTGAGVIARFMSHKTPARYVIGSWSHGARHDTDPYHKADAPVSPSFETQYQSIADFLAPLKTANDNIKVSRELYYQTMGSGVWRKTDVWPPEGMQKKLFFFASNNKLTQLGADKGFDEYRVNFDAGTGQTTRWSTQWGKRDVSYGDRTTADDLLLVYTSAPLDEDMEITGHPVVTLQMSSSEPDGQVIVYLESVAPDGRVTMITEGQIRLVHRKISLEKPPFPQFGPYHSYERKDGLPMISGEVAEVSFVLLPTSIIIRKGHSLRLAIAGHDKDTFVRVPENKVPLYKIFRGGEKASFIEIPMKAVDMAQHSSEEVNPFTKVRENKK